MSTSPKPSSPTAADIATAMNFYDALHALVDGKRITRFDWGDSAIYGVLRNGSVQLHRANGKFYNWIINDGDLLAVDWMIVN